MAFQIDRGMKTFQVKDIDGTVLGEVRFNPGDLGLIGRWNECEKKIRELQKTAANTPEGIFAADRTIKEQIDFALGCKASDVFFQGVSCFAVCNDGELVLEKVLQSIQPVIQEAQQAAMRASEQRMAAYTNGYEGTDRGLAPGQSANGAQP